MTTNIDAHASDLAQLARLHGIQPLYVDVFGHEQIVSTATLRSLLHELGVEAVATDGVAESSATQPVVALKAGQRPCVIPMRAPSRLAQVHWSIALEDGDRIQGVADLTATTRADEATDADRLELDVALPPGYHHLRFDELATDTLLLAAPDRMQKVPQEAGNGRVWGPAVQLYALRSARHWGIGDFTDLANLVDVWAGLGAGVIGLNPLHALFLSEPEHASPYSPSSRLWLDTRYLDVTAIEDFDECDEARAHVASAAFQARLTAARDASLVDHAAVSSMKRDVLDMLYRLFRQQHLDVASQRATAFRAFQRASGQALRRHATFEAIDAQVHASGRPGHGWRAWPNELQDVDSPQVTDFAAQNIERIEFFEYLQWQAALQLAQVQQRCTERGMAVGLYLDMAVSVDPGGSDVWGHRALFAEAAGIGAPPDEFNPNGQGWGLAPLRPDSLRAARHDIFIQTLVSVMRHAGAIRIDHVMGLMRLFWVPEGADASAGAYVHYPFDELLAIIAIESRRRGTIVIGEDLGTVDPDVRQALTDSGVLSYRLVYFERTADGGFTPPHDYPAQALAAISTHDLATFAGWWAGRDLEVRHALHLFPNEALFDAQQQARERDREQLVAALVAAGLLDDAAVQPLKPFGSSPPSGHLIAAVHGFLHATPSALAMVQLEDLEGAVEQANLPGTTTQHPNWRRKLTVPIEDMTTRPGYLAPLAAFGVVSMRNETA